MIKNIRTVILRPFSLLYWGFLLFLLLTVASSAYVYFRELLIQGVGIPPELFSAILFLSLVGSFINIPLKTLEINNPLVYLEQVNKFGVDWVIPQVQMGKMKTLLTINVGGGLVPIFISLYLLLFSIPRNSPDLLATYIKTLVILVVVAISTYNSSEIVKGMGIATPAFGPPTMTAFITFLINWVSPVTCPTQIAYVGGTLGALIGADILNLSRLSELQAPSVSIGGAGTFDGVYLTGLVSVLLVLLLR
jgi:uncharacterized membrane protein